MENQGHIVELIKKYLSGDLTPTEQAEFEELRSENPKFESWVEEIRSSEMEHVDWEGEVRTVHNVDEKGFGSKEPVKHFQDPGRKTNSFKPVLSLFLLGLLGVLLWSLLSKPDKIYEEKRLYQTDTIIDEDLENRDLEDSIEAYEYQFNEPY